MFLNYFSLGIALMGVTLVFYGFIYIHEIPYEIAKKRDHPQADAIYVACWLSLFTLHAIWPIVFLWAITNPKALPVRLIRDTPAQASEMALRVEALEKEIARLKQGQKLEAMQSGAGHD